MRGGIWGKSLWGIPPGVAPAFCMGRRGKGRVEAWTRRGFAFSRRVDFLTPVAGGPSGNSRVSIGIPASLPSIPASLPSIPASLPSIPASLPSVPASLPSIPASRSRSPASLPNIPRPAQAVPPLCAWPDKPKGGLSDLFRQASSFHTATFLISATASLPFSMAVRMSNILLLHPPISVTSLSSKEMGAWPYPQRSKR